MDYFLSFLYWVGRSIIQWKIFKWVYAREFAFLRWMRKDRRQGRQRTRTLRQDRRAAADRRRAVHR